MFSEINFNYKIQQLKLCEFINIQNWYNEK